MNSFIVGLKIKSYSSFAIVAKILREYQECSFSEIKAKIDRNEYLLCYACSDRLGVKKVISCYEKLVASSVEVLLYELDNRETTIEKLRIRDNTYDSISNEIDNEDNS